jgi:hypothetical protein
MARSLPSSGSLSLYDIHYAVYGTYPTVGSLKNLEQIVQDSFLDEKARSHSFGDFYGYVHVAQPNITSISPTTNLKRGDTITVNGTNFSDVTNAYLYHPVIGNISGSFTVINSTQINFVIGTGTYYVWDGYSNTSYNVIVENGKSDFSDTSFSMIAPQPVPNVTSFSPSTDVQPGSKVTVTGTNMYDVNKLHLRGTASTVYDNVPFLRVSPTSITFIVPSVAPAGYNFSAIVENDAGSQTQSTATFTIYTAVVNPVVTVTSSLVTDYGTYVDIRWTINLDKAFTTSTTISADVLDGMDGDSFSSVSSGTSGTTKYMYSTHNKTFTGGMGRMVELRLRTSSNYTVGSPSSSEALVSAQSGGGGGGGGGFEPMI